MHQSLRIVFLLTPLALSLCAMALRAQEPEVQSDTKPRHWRLIWTGNPQQQVTASWSTTGQGKQHRVYYDTVSREGKLLEYAEHCDSSADGLFTAHTKQPNTKQPKLPFYYHHARLRDLQPGTIYYLVMVSDGQASREFHFRTAPADDAAFSLLFGGDSRSGLADRCKINEMISVLAEREPGIMALAHGGDYVFDGRKLTQWIAWLDNYELCVSKTGRMLPIIPARGNHEAYGPLFDQVFDSPGGGLGKNYFATNLNKECLWLTLNTEISMGGDQRDWLEAQFKQAVGIRWQLLQYHRAAWPAVKRASAGLQHWVPLFDDYLPDLACESDGHVAKRTVPIRFGIKDPQGVVYIGEGGMGVPQRKARTERWFLQGDAYAGSVHHLQWISIGKEELRCRTITLGCKVVDDYRCGPRDRAKLNKRRERRKTGPWR